MHTVALHIDTSVTSTDYQGGVLLQWNDLKVDSLQNRHPKFLGYTVMRKARGDTAGNYTLLTPSAVTTADFYYDLLPQNGVGSFTYRVAAVDRRSTARPKTPRTSSGRLRSSPRSRY